MSIIKIINSDNYVLAKYEDCLLCYERTYFEKCILSGKDEAYINAIILNNKIYRVFSFPIEIDILFDQIPIENVYSDSVLFNFLNDLQLDEPIHLNKHKIIYVNNIQDLLN